jgi:hypothetical protein
MPDIASFTVISHLREISAFPKRHTLRFPSAVIRRRLHEPQKCSLIDVINPICPLKPGTLYAYDENIWGKETVIRYVTH